MPSVQPDTEPTRKPASSPPTRAELVTHGDMIGGDEVEGDKVTIGDINDSVVAIGKGATAIQLNIDRALSAVEVANQAEEQAYRRLGEVLSDHVQDLAEQAERAKNQAARTNPYKALLSYDLKDAPLFFGREENCDELMRALDNGRLTVLYAESGAGKTSLLKAGLMSRLVAREDVPVYLRPRDAPIPWRLKNTLLPALDETPILADDSLRDFLRRATKLLPDRELVVLVDQFEDVFDLQGEEVRADFGKQLAECLDDQTLRVRWVLALRQEYFYRLGEFRQIKEPFGNVMPLPRMTREQAQAVIVEPSRLRGVTWDQDVVDRVLAELAPDDPGILPVQLQLVCAELFQRADKDGAITLAAYQDAGAVQGILGSYLNNVLERQMAPGQREVARQLLENLAASEPDMRLSKGALTELPHGDAIDGNTTDEVLKQLQDAFLVRMEVTEGREMVELAHRYLLDQLQPDEETKEVVAAKKLLERWVQEYDEQGMLLDADRLAIIETQWDKLGVADDSRAAELRKKSADKLKSQRGYVRLGIGAVLILMVFALLSVVGLGVARTEARNSESTAQAVQTVAADARATQTAAEAAASDAEARASVAAATLRRAFQQTGVVPVADGPVALAWDGSSLWVANSGSGTVQQIEPVTGAVVATVDVGDSPGALAWDGASLWVANADSNTVQQIDPVQGVVATVRVENGPVALAWDGSSMWVANAGSNTVQQIDPVIGAVVATVDVGDSPSALAWDGASLWVANASSNTVQQIDPVQGVVATVRVGNGPLALAWDGSSMWVANVASYTVQQIDPVMGAVVATVEVGRWPSELIWDGSSLWVANSGSGTVQQIDLVKGAVVATIGAGDNPVALAWDGSSLWVANGSSDTVRQVDPSQGAVAPTISVGSQPSALALDGTSLWVANVFSDTVRQIDPVMGAVVATVYVGDSPSALAWDGASLWVANAGSNTVQQIDPVQSVVATVRVENGPVALAWDGSSMWVANSDSGTVQQIDPVKGAVVATIRVGDTMLVGDGDTPSALVWDGSSLWVANSGSGTVQQIEPVTGAVVATIRVGDTMVVVDWPSALASNGTSLWVANSSSGTVQQINSRSLNLILKARQLAQAGDVTP